MYSRVGEGYRAGGRRGHGASAGSPLLTDVMRLPSSRVMTTV